MELLHFQGKHLYQYRLVSFLKGIHLELLNATLKWNCNTFKERNSVRIDFTPCQKESTWRLSDSNGTASVQEK